MGIQDIKDRLNTDKYEFLRTDPARRKHINSYNSRVHCLWNKC